MAEKRFLTNRDRKRLLTPRPSTEADLVPLPGAGHGFKGQDADTAEKAMFAFFDKHLKKK